MEDRGRGKGWRIGGGERGGGYGEGKGVNDRGGERGER